MSEIRLTKIRASVPPILNRNRPLTTSYRQPDSDFNAQNSNGLFSLPRFTVSLHSTICLLQLLQSAHKTLTYTPACSVLRCDNVFSDACYPPTPRPRFPPHNLSYYVLRVRHRQNQVRALASIPTAYELRVDNE